MKTPCRWVGVVLIAMFCAQPLQAQGVAGSTMRIGSADSLFHAFTKFVQTGAFTFQRADSSRREVVFLAPKMTRERLFVRFVQRGDSTAITGQSADRGIVGTVASLDAVRRFLVELDSLAARRDSLAEVSWIRRD